MTTIAAAFVLLAASATAAYPDKNIRLVNPYPVAGPADIAGSVPVNRVLRLMQNHATPALTDTMAEQVRLALAYGLGRTVTLERRPRQRMLEAHRHVAQAAPDGHTLLLSGNASFVIHPRLARNGTFDPRGELAPVALVARMPMVLIASTQSGFKSIADLVEAARGHPGRLHYGSSGDYSTAHLAGELFGALAGIRLVHVAYNGGTAAVNAVLAGQVETAFVALPAALPHLHAGRLHALGIATRERFPGLPGLPTIGESDLPGVEASAWYGLFAPAHTPREVVARLDDEIAASLHTRQSRALWLAQGVQAVHVGAADFDELLHSEREKWLPVINAIGARS